MVKAEYEKIAKKYKLPSYDEVNNELEISDIEAEEFLLRHVRKKISERIEAMASVIGSILQPSADSLADMHECRFFDDKDKGKIVDIYKKLMTFDRIAIEADIKQEEAADAALIADFFKELPGIKKQILPFMEKMKTCWKKETEIEENLEYFG
jgi:hypothetical protein